MKLTETQEQVLNTISDEFWMSAYEIGSSLSALKALANKDLLEVKLTNGAAFFPRTGTLFKKVN